MKLEGQTGTVLWMELLGGPEHVDDRGWAITVGPDDHPVVTGITGNLDGTAGFLTVKLRNSNGATIWSRSAPGANNNVSERSGWLDVCENGDIVMVNKTWTPETSYDVIVHRYASEDGAVVWTAQHGSPDGTADDPRHMVRATSGDILISGVNGGDFQVLNVDEQDGSLVWSSTYDGPAGAYDAANWVTEGPGGTIIAGGFSTGLATSWDATIVGFQPSDGTVLWTERFDAGGQQADEASLLVVSPRDDLYVVGYGYTLTNDSDLLTLRYQLDQTLAIVGSPPVEPFISVYPNPVSSGVSLAIETNAPGLLRVTVHDITGRLVRSIDSVERRNGHRGGGWDGRDELGRAVPPGIYLAHAVGNGWSVSRKIIRIR